MAEAAAIQRFRFDRSFEALGGPGDHGRPAGRSAERTFTSQDVEQARAEGFARGRAESVGAEEARREAERLRQQVLDTIASQVGAVLDGAAESAQAAVTEAVLVAAAIVRKMMPRLPALQMAARECGAEDRLRVLAGDGVSPGDCRIEWRNGGLLRDRLAMTRAIDAVIERSLGAAALPEGPTAERAEETTGGE